MKIMQLKRRRDGGAEKPEKPPEAVLDRAEPAMELA